MSADTNPHAASSEEAFFAACAGGDVATLRALLEREPTLVRARDADGATGLHVAVRHEGAMRTLLEHGADPNVRDRGDSALPLHLAAGGGHLGSARALLDAGSDVQGEGDLHRLDTIGWATVFAEPHRALVDLLVERGARHHVFSAIALNDVDLLRRVVAGDPASLRRRLSHFEQEQTPLHYVVAPADGLVGGTFRTGDHYALLDALIELGAELEATDAKGRTPLAVAMLRGDEEAMKRLHAAGAQLPPSVPARPQPSDGLAASMGRITPMLPVDDMHESIAWYEAIGFVRTASHDEGDALDWAALRFGEAELMLVPATDGGRGARRDLRVWIRTDRLDELYDLLRARQLERAAAVLAGQAAEPLIRFTGDLYTAFYGQREFCIRDPNGVDVNFYQPLPASSDG